MSQEWKMVPGRMLLDKETIGAINYHCGDGSNLTIDECSEGVLWVGTVTDDDGKEVYGLHISTAEYPEEGSSTIVEFAAPVPPASGEPETVAVVNETDGVFKETIVEHRPGIDALPAGTELVDRSHVTRLLAENAALQQRLNTADQRVEDLQKDKERLDSLEANFWDVRHHSSALGDTGDYTSCVEIVGHWMDKPKQRVIGENYNENLRAAIDQAMTADAYPPARPEYPDTEADHVDENWHMNPCKQGHRDVGACQGKAFCHTCDETITAETTQQAFEQWNASHPAIPQ